jgi:DNA-binding response OmpR family regulator
MNNRVRVLIADCHEDSLMGIEHLLENEGFDTTTAWTGKDAFRILDGYAFDLIILNEYLPDGNAETLLRAVRRRGVGTPCLIMQPSAPPMLDAACFRGLGVVDVVCKHSFGDLVGRVRAHVKPTPAFPTQYAVSA